MKKYLTLSLLLLLAACSGDHSIVNNVEEREANEIVVYLASKGIAAQKVAAPSSAVGGAGSADLYNISVDERQTTEAMALLNSVGLPRRHGTTLLDLFAKTGFVSSDREDTIRYQAGLAEELKNTIRKMDGVLDADVQISFPQTEAIPTPGVAPPKTTAAVYIKHQGVMDDPNSLMEIKVKRLVAGSVNGLNFEDVAVIADRSRLASIHLNTAAEPISAKTLQQTYVSIWGVVLTKGSLARFRFLFFLLSFLLLAALGALGFLVYQFYPVVRKARESQEIEPPGS